VRRAARIARMGRGLKYGGTEANEAVLRYIERKRLAKIGITIDAATLPARWIDEFLEIDRVLDEIDAEEAKKSSKTPRVNRG